MCQLRRFIVLLLKGIPYLDTFTNRSLGATVNTYLDARELSANWLCYTGSVPDVSFWVQINNVDTLRKTHFLME